MTLLDTRIPAGLDADGMTADERRQFEQLRAHRALGLIMQRVQLNIPVFDWLIRANAIEIMIGGLLSDHEKRARIMLLAEQFGFEYTETKHGASQNMVAASGIYGETPVRFWQLVAPCSCGCGVASC